MKHILYILPLLFSYTIYGQSRDTRAELEIDGRVNEVSISPDEKIWLVTAMGNTYYTNSIDSNWHYGKPVIDSVPESIFDYPNLERISFFNKDTAIMTGYFSADKNNKTKNSGYYLTENGGKTWTLLDFGDDSWIYNVFNTPNGSAWMGGSSGEIYFSKDFGRHWEKLNSPYNSSSRMHSIFMQNSTEGISGALENYIYTTSNNWKFSKRIRTPFDQKKYKKQEGYTDNRIEKILIWKNYFVVNQDGKIFYTESNNIDWKSFPVKLYDFAIDEKTNNLFAISDSLEVLSFSTPDQFQLFAKERLLYYPKEIKAIHGALFILSSSNNVYKINEHGITRSFLYTEDRKIEEPDIVREGGQITWGTNGNQVYLADYNEKKWYRENQLDFYIRDFKLLTDSIAILWNGRSNYSYSLKDRKTKEYFPQTPLKDFFSAPIKTITINAGSRGCFHSYTDEVRYERINDSTFETKTISNEKQFEEKTQSPFKNTISSSRLSGILKMIDNNPAAFPSLKDFNITETDKQHYLEMVEDEINKDERGKANKKARKEFLNAFTPVLDTLNDATLAAVLRQQENWTSTTSNWFTIELINENGDRLDIDRLYYVNTHSWNLPWRFRYQGQYFNCYNIELSKLIRDCIPDNFIDKNVFSNSRLILEIADYLWKKKLRDSSE